METKSIPKLRSFVFVAVNQGIIEGRENEIAEGLLVLGKEDLDFIKNEPYFPDVIALLWRNSKVRKHIENIELSLSLYSKILVKVVLTPAESDKIFESVAKRVDVRDKSSLKRTLLLNSGSIIVSAEEIFKIVFGKK